MPPSQSEGCHAGVSSRQPSAHLKQQLSGSLQQCWGMLNPKTQLQTRAENFGQGLPDVDFGRMAISLVQGEQALFVKATAQPASGQDAHIAEGSAADLSQRHHVRTDGTQAFHWQTVQQFLQRLFETVLDATPGQGMGGHAVGGPGDLAHAEFLGFRNDTVAQCSTSSEQASAGLHLDQDSVL
jgi:hypothetical protein